ncbi:MAG: sugar ABC transporter permease [Ruminococcus flavefaciens]|nr:sugar ABC transporter permease [Ruminococcus flavefaciens]MCM1059212.1 sugar ABC transporter permease [Eubacterium sp.]
MASAAQKRIKSISYAKYGYIFILPFFLVYFFFQLWPLVNTFVLSFKGNDTTVEEFVGFDNYKAILFDTDVDMDVVKGTSPKLENMSAEEKKEVRKAEQAKVAQKAQHDTFVKSFGNTIILWLGNFIPQIILSLSLAVWFTDAKLKIPGKGFFKVVMYMPNIITAASVAVLFLSLCSESKYGALNQILHSVGIVDDITSTNSTDFVKFVSGKWEPRIVVMFIQTWMWFGNTMIMLMSGIMGINPSLFEAASIDGASSGQVFRKITLPLLSPIMVYTLVTSMIGGLQMFDIPYLFHKGVNDINAEVRTVAVYIYERFHTPGSVSYSFGYSGAASVLLFIVTLILGSITFYMNRDVDAIAKKKQRKKLAKQAKLQNKQFGGLSI